MTYAIIETGGKQLRVEPGRFYDVERLAVDEAGTVVIDRVLYIDNGGEISIGQPVVADATVEATVMRHLRDRKIIVYKMRPKKKTRKKQGHRQELTRLMIDSISLNGQVLSGNTATETAPVEKPVDVEEPVEVTEPVAETKAEPVAETKTSKKAEVSS
jgi:large subunit ribosomal protein L21